MVTLYNKTSWVLGVQSHTYSAWRGCSLANTKRLWPHRAMAKLVNEQYPDENEPPPPRWAEDVKYARSKYSYRSLAAYLKGRPPSTLFSALEPDVKSSKLAKR